MCTRVFNNLRKSFTTTGRNMDWATQLPTSLFTFKKDLNKSGLKKSEMGSSCNPVLKWISKYNSVVTMVGDEKNGYAASDGINSEGLVANVLYDSGATYGKGCSGNLDVLRWVQYVLDMFPNVSKVVDEFSDTNIQLVGADVPGSDKSASLHLSVSDKDGDTAIIEAVDVKFNIYYECETEGEKSKKTFKIMTNEPDYKTQVMLNQYWRWQWSQKNDFSSHTIPGGPFPTDRFERASFYLNTLSPPESMDESLAQVRSIIANTSVPIGFDGQKLKIDGHPNVAPTLWSTLSNHTDKIYYFCNARTPDVMWIDLKNLNKEHDVCMLEVVVEIYDGTFKNYSFNGLVNDRLKAVNDPYSLQ